MTDERSGWTKVATVDDVAPGEVVGVKVDGEPVVLANVDGDLLAASDVCTHEYVLLHDGWLDDELIECPEHGSQFDLRTGKARGLPATQPLPLYEVRVEGDDVFLRARTERMSEDA
jgi:3-phenylpropionate/trans-cinnamate dioxygenase ferredoxin subunit